MFRNYNLSVDEDLRGEIIEKMYRVLTINRER